MYPFYGNRPGNSFVIITTYSSYTDMVNNFKKGPNYTVVHYDEYVMINSKDADNGKIYRRGYDFNNNETGGAEYIGQITGTAAAKAIKAIDIDSSENKLKVSYDDGSAEFFDVLTNLQYGAATAHIDKWLGIGQINSQNGKKVITFTLTLTQLIPNDKNNISITAGKLIGKEIGNEKNITIELNTETAAVTKQLTGLNVVVTTEAATDEITSPRFINLSISNLELSFE